MENDSAKKYLFGLLNKMQEQGGSDLFITAGAPPSMRLHGKITRITDKSLTPQQSMALAVSVM
ncbi:MAG: type IV pili twitching motility protein PilT, partial [Pseudomonadota bacterium]